MYMTGKILDKKGKNPLLKACEAQRVLKKVPVIYDFGISIKEYEGLDGEIPTPSIETCPYCSKVVVMKRHGFYERFIVLPEKVSRKLLIRRLRCPACKRTFGVLPVQAIPYRQLSWLVLWHFLCFRFIESQTLLTSLGRALGQESFVWHSQGLEWICWVRGWWNKLGRALSVDFLGETIGWGEDIGRDCKSLLSLYPNASPLQSAVITWRNLVKGKRAISLWAPALGCLPIHR